MCESFAFAVELMARADAIMAMPAPVFVGPLSRGLLVEIPVEEPLPPFVLGLCTRTGTQMTSLATALSRAVADLRDGCHNRDKHETGARLGW